MRFVKTVWVTLVLVAIAALSLSPLGVGAAKGVQLVNPAQSPPTPDEMVTIPTLPASALSGPARYPYAEVRCVRQRGKQPLMAPLAYGSNLGEADGGWNLPFFARFAAEEGDQGEFVTVEVPSADKIACSLSVVVSRHRTYSVKETAVGVQENSPGTTAINLTICSIYSAAAWGTCSSV